MAVKIRWSDKNGILYSGLRNDFAKYERNISSGKLNCPLWVEFRNKKEVVVSTKMIPLSINGKPKIDLLG